MSQRRETGRRVFVATDSFTASVDGADVNVVRGVTLVREGHELLDRFAHLFKLVEPHYEVREVEQATAAPGERR